jgi:hypothetical protein
MIQFIICRYCGNRIPHGHPESDNGRIDNFYCTCGVHYQYGRKPQRIIFWGFSGGGYGAHFHPRGPDFINPDIITLDRFMLSHKAAYIVIWPYLPDNITPSNIATKGSLIKGFLMMQVEPTCRFCQRKLGNPTHSKP